MLPRHLMKETITIWNFLETSADGPNVYQKTVIQRTWYGRKDKAVVTGAGIATQDTLKVLIDLRVSEPQDLRQYMPPEQYAANWADPVKKTDQDKYFTANTGDYVTLGNVADTLPGLNPMRKDLKVSSVSKHGSPDGRCFLRVECV